MSTKAKKYEKKKKTLVSKLYNAWSENNFCITLQGSWEKKIIEKVHNLKARTKRPSDGEGTPKAKRGRPKVSLVLTRYPPMRDFGDDDIAMERNLQQLKMELDKDKQVVLSLSRQTYSARRTVILSESDVSVHSLLQQFNELKKPYVVSAATCCTCVS